MQELLRQTKGVSRTLLLLDKSIGRFKVQLGLRGRFIYLAHAGGHAGSRSP